MNDHQIDRRLSIEATLESGKKSVTHITGITKAKLHFGPHFFVDVFVEKDQLRCAIGATHHGVIVDASEVSGQLDSLLQELQHAHPELAF